MNKNQLKKLILETVVETHQYHIDEALLLENRISDFKSKYDSKLAPATINYIISHDPSKNQKYLNWIGKILVSVDNDDYISPDEIMKDITLFHKNIKGVDLYSLKSFDQLQDLVHKKTEPSTRQKIINEADIIVNDKDWLVVAPTTHESSMFFGGSTHWCISSGSENHWNKYYNEDGDCIIMIKNRKKTKGSSDWKICLTIPPGDDNLRYTTMYDVNDHATSVRNSSFYSEIPEYVVGKISDYVSNNHDGQHRAENYLQDKENAEIEEYMQSDDSINDTLREYIQFMRKKYTRYADKFKWYELKKFLIKFVGEEIMASMCRHIVQSSISEYGWGDYHIRDLNQFDNFLYNDDPENAAFFNYGLNSYINEIIEVSLLLNIIENNIGTKNFDRIDANYELTNALTDCTERYAKTINQSNQLQLPEFPQTIEKFKTYDINDIINLLNKYGYTQMANILKSYSINQLQEIQYKQLIAFMV